MKASEKNKLNILVNIEAAKDFFSRGHALAKQIDEGKKITPTRIISFEDPADLVDFLTTSKLALLSALRQKSDSMSTLAKKLHRSRVALGKDVQLLESVGIVESEYRINPGHGRCRFIKAVDLHPITLHVEARI